MSRIHWFGFGGRKKTLQHAEAIKTGSLLGRLESVTDRLEKYVGQLEIELEKEQSENPDNS